MYTDYFNQGDNSPARKGEIKNCNSLNQLNPFLQFRDWGNERGMVHLKNLKGIDIESTDYTNTYLGSVRIDVKTFFMTNIKPDDPDNRYFKFEHKKWISHCDPYRTIPDFIPDSGWEYRHDGVFRDSYLANWISYGDPNNWIFYYFKVDDLRNLLARPDMTQYKNPSPHFTKNDDGYSKVLYYEVPFTVLKPIILFELNTNNNTFTRC